MGEMGELFFAVFFFFCINVLFNLFKYWMSLSVRDTQTENIIIFGYLCCDVIKEYEHRNMLESEEEF